MASPVDLDELKSRKSIDSTRSRECTRKLSSWEKLAGRGQDSVQEISAAGGSQVSIQERSIAGRGQDSVQ